MPLRSISFLNRRSAAAIGSLSWTRIRNVIRPPSAKYLPRRRRGKTQKRPSLPAGKELQPLPGDPIPVRKEAIFKYKRRPPARVEGSASFAPRKGSVVGGNGQGHAPGRSFRGCRLR